MFFVVVKLYMIFAEFDYVASEADLEMKTLLAPDFWTMFRPLFFGTLAVAYLSYILDLTHGSCSILLA